MLYIFTHIFYTNGKVKVQTQIEVLEVKMRSKRGSGPRKMALTVFFEKVPDTAR